MQERQFETTGSAFFYEIRKGEIHITGYRGKISKVEVPAQIEGCPVTCIAKKAFLSQKGIYSITLPERIEEIGDWAFAHCDELSRISLPKREIRFGKAVFKDCGKLKRIETAEETKSLALAEEMSAYGGEPRSAAEPELLAAAVTKLDTYYLLDLPAAGSRGWLEKWDTRFQDFLRAPDQEGYNQVVYGEEDYIGMNQEAYINGKRKEKIRLAFLRLLHSNGLAPSFQEELEGFLRSLTKGQASEETWQVIREEHGTDREYYALFAKLSCIHEGNCDGILADLGEDNPEMKAFFLKRMEERRSMDDFFQGLQL